MPLNFHDVTYSHIARDILETGEERRDRTGVGTVSVFGRQMRYDLRYSFPALTTKKLQWKKVVSELLWFIEGSGDERRLAEIHYGKPREELTDKKTIWTENANAPTWKHKARYEGDLGRVYGVQWRRWRAIDGDVKIDPMTGEMTAKIIEIDQLMNLINGLKKDPWGRRHILNAWNPGELDQMALPPCHVLAQFVVSNDGELSCELFMRSVDTFLGMPFNIASYALFTMMIAQVCDLKPGELIISTGDTHLYLNSIDQIREQLMNESFAPPRVVLNPEIKDITAFTMDDIQLVDYQSHKPIKAEMAV